MTEYAETDLAQTALDNSGHGTPSKLFTSSGKMMIDKHFQWMKGYGIDGVAVQHFIGSVGSTILKSPNSASLKIKQAAESTGRIFYICYDISSTGMESNWDDAIQFDWVYNMEQNNKVTASPGYAIVKTDGEKGTIQLKYYAAFGKNPCDKIDLTKLFIP